MNSDDFESIRAAIRAVESQRSSLGDAATDAALAGLTTRLAQLEDRGHLPEARRQITVLFADVSGFTALSERLDAEVVRDVMNALWQRLDAVLVAHGAHIDKHIGDAVMALFGVPFAQEDDAARAVRAALGMQAELAAFGATPAATRSGAELAMRVGIHTGAAVLGEVASTSEYTAMGDTVNLASRIESNAPVGGVLVSATTYRHVRGLFDTGPPQPIRVKGKSHPIRVYAVRGERARSFHGAARGLEGIEAPLVGRDAELAVLVAEALGPGSASSRGVIILGDAGVGKTRLLRELDLALDAQPDPPVRLKGRAEPPVAGAVGPGPGQPYHVLRHAVADHLGLPDAGSPKARRQLAAAFTAAGHADARAAASLAATLLGWSTAAPPGDDSSGADPRMAAWNALAELLEAWGTPARSTLVLLEDLHWADDPSLDFLEFLLARPHGRVRLVAASRNDLVGRRPAWDGRKAPGVPLTRLSLEPLNAVAMARLLTELNPGLAATHSQFLLDRAEGNPFYLEELVHMLTEEGGAVGASVPPTLTAVLQARLGHLPENQREALDAASVLGRHFWDAAVTHLTGTDGRRPPDFDGLVGAHAILPAPVSTLPPAAEFMFRHALLRDVTYEAVLLRRRRLLHGLAAQWLTLWTSEHGLGTLAGAVARHLEQAQDLVQSASWYGRAGDQAFGAFAHREAVAEFSRGLAALDAVADPDPPAAAADLRFQLLAGRAQALGRLGEREAQAADLLVMAALAPELGAAAQATTALGRAALAWAVGDFAEAATHGSEALDLYRRAQDGLGEAASLRHLGRVAREVGDFPLARTYLEEAAAGFLAAGAEGDRANAMLQLGALESELGRFEAAKALLNQGLALAEGSGSVWEVAWALDNLTVVHACLGDFSSALDHSEGALESAARIGDPFREVGAWINRGGLLAAVGDYAGAEAATRRALDISCRIRDASTEANALVNLGEILVHQGRPEAALQSLSAGLDLAAQLGRTYLEVAGGITSARALLAIGEADAAHGTAGKALAAAAAAGLEGHAALALAVRARAGLALDDIAGALADAKAAEARMLAAGGAEGSEALIHYACYLAAAAAGLPDAGDSLQAATALLRARAGGLPDASARRRYLEEVPDHAAIMAAAGRQADEA